MSDPLIGITTRTYFVPQGAGEPQSETNLAACAYVRAVAEAGGDPILIPLVADEPYLGRVLELCDGIVLTGGWDIDPGLYGQEPHRLLKRVDARKDDVERVLAGMLLERTVPVLAICRGAEMLNVVAGGTLHQDVSLAGASELLKHDQRSVGPTAWHSIRVEPASRLAAALGLDESGGFDVRVNSHHHQCVDRLAARFVATAHAPDGILEAFEDPAHPFMVGVQCHPEEPAGEGAWRSLFEAFISASS